MNVKIVYSLTAQQEIAQLQSLLGRVSTDSAFSYVSECLSSLGTILHYLSTDPKHIPAVYHVHKLWRDFKGYLGAYLEPSKHADGLNSHRMVFRVMSAESGFYGLDDPRFPWLRDRVGDLSTVDFVVHIWVGCFDYHTNIKSRSRSSVKDSFTRF